MKYYSKCRSNPVILPKRQFQIASTHSRSKSGRDSFTVGNCLLWPEDKTDQTSRTSQFWTVIRCDSLIPTLRSEKSLTNWGQYGQSGIAILAILGVSAAFICCGLIHNPCTIHFCSRLHAKETAADWTCAICPTQRRHFRVWQGPLLLLPSKQTASLVHKHFITAVVFITSEQITPTSFSSSTGHARKNTPLGRETERKKNPGLGARRTPSKSGVVRSTGNDVLDCSMPEKCSC